MRTRKLDFSLHPNQEAPSSTNFTTCILIGLVPDGRTCPILSTN